MSGIKWTSEQLEAITEQGRNLLVAAAAGAGKTAVLVERIIRRITDESNPVDIDSLLVVTFTNAAASEMRERVRDALERAFDERPGCTRLQRQLSLLNKATITTMHSFCLETLRNNFHRLDIDPGFRVADETETVLMELKALEETFEEQYVAPQQEFLELVERYGGKRDDGMLQQTVLNLYHYVQSHPWPENWLHDAAEAFNLPEDTDFGDTQWADVLIEDISMQLHGMLDILREAVGIIGRCPEFGAYIHTYESDIKNIESLIKLLTGRWDNLQRAFMDIGFSRLPNCKKEADPVLKEHVKGIRDEVKDRLRGIRDGVFMLSTGEAMDMLRTLYPLMKHLTGLVTVFGQKYSDKKKEKSLLDFNDLEHYCLAVLTEKDEKGGIVPSETAKAYGRRFVEILIDEYQDTNLVQEAIINVISCGGKEGPPVFAVGDVKQSIYRFRQSRPELFLEKYNDYPAKTGKRDRKIMLYRNFRSRDSIIETVNRVFGSIMSRTVGELDYTEEEALNAGAGYPELPEEKCLIGGPVEIHILDRAGSSEEPADTALDNIPDEEANKSYYIDEEPDAIQAEAMLIAERIKEMTASVPGREQYKVYDKKSGGYRCVEFRDIVVLLRAAKNWAEVFEEELCLAGIPVYADTTAGYFGAAEIQVIMSLLQIIDNPMQDIPFLAVLRSPVANFTPEELIDIRLNNKEVPFYQAMKELAGKADGNTALKANAFLDDLERWRDKARHMSVDELLWYLFTDTNFYSFTGTMPGGNQRQANLRMLYERARRYEETGYRGLFNFISFINNLKSDNGDLGSAGVSGENENVVRVMSIHKSKGLEFPVVIVAGLGKRFNFQDTTRRLLMHQDLGLGPDYVDPELRLASTTLAKEAIKSRIKLENLSEEMRILYVAFTRAREKLIITGSVRDLKKAMADWRRGCTGASPEIAVHRTAMARTYFDWLGPCFLKTTRRDASLMLSHTHIGDTGLAPAETAAALSSGEVKANPAACTKGESSHDVFHDKGLSIIGKGIPEGLAGGNEYEGDNLQWKSGCWQVSVWNKKDLLKKRVNEAANSNKKIADPDVHNASVSPGIYSDEINRRLGWEYRYKESARLPVKLSVTELKRRTDMEFAEEYGPLEVYSAPPVEKPSFLDESKGFSNAEKGSILHFVMQHLNINGPLNNDGLKGQIAAMVKRELLTKQEARTVDIERLDRFFRSQLGQRLLRSDSVKREVPFNLYIKSIDVYKDLDVDVYGNETILLQGVIDCFFEENGNIILVDYKTDYVPGQQGTTWKPPMVGRYQWDTVHRDKDNEQNNGYKYKGNGQNNGHNLSSGLKEIMEKYRLQIECYSEALKRITGKPVGGKYLYLFHTGDIIKY